MFERVVAAIKDRPKGTALVVAGELDTELEDPENNRRGTEIAAAMTAAGVEDMMAHFLAQNLQMGTGETDVEHGARGQGRTVTDGLSSRDRPKSIYECVRLGPTS